MVYDEPVISLDIVGTVAALSHVPIDSDRPLDGVNLKPFFLGEAEGRPHDATYMRKFDSESFMVRNGACKLVIPGRDAKPQVYNLIQDIGESTNIADKNRQVRDQLKQKLDRWTAELVDPGFLGLIHTKAFQKNQEKIQHKG